MGGHTVVPNGLPGSSEWLERLECAIPIHVVCHLLREYVKGIILELGGIMAKIHQILLRMRAFSIHHHPGQGMFASLRIRLRHFRTSFLWLIYRSYQTWMEEHLTAFMICWKIDPFSAIIFPWKSSNFCSCQFWLPEGSTYLMFTRLEGIGMTAWPSRAQKLDFRPLPHQQASVSGNERYWCWEVEIDHPWIMARSMGKIDHLFIFRNGVQNGSLRYP